jgi:hypothetical protein
MAIGRVGTIAGFILAALGLVIGLFDLSRQS